MDGQRVPNLEEMDDQQAHRFLTELLSNLSPEEEYDVRHQDYVMEMPQSGESIRGRERMREFQEAYPTSYPAAPGAGQGRAVGCRGGHRLRWRAGVRRGADLIELKDGKMWRTGATMPSLSRRLSGERSGSSGWN